MSADSAAVAPAQTSEKSIDPVCGMIVDPRHAKHHTDYRDQIYYFCCAGCLGKFSADPAKFLEPRAPAPAAAADAIYTCPMHPEIEQVGPGACPICGMALDPKDVLAGPADNSELIDMMRRFWVSAALSLPLLVIAMAHMLPGQPMQIVLSPGLAVWLQLVLATPVVLWGGLVFFERGWASIRTGNLNMFTLIALGTGVGLCVQPGGDTGARTVSGRAPNRGRSRRCLFRGGGGHHHAGATGPGAGTAGARTHQRRHPRLARPGAQDRASHPRRRT